MYHSTLSCSGCGLPAAGSAVHLYGAPPPQKVGADQVMSVSSPGKRFIAISLALFETFVAPFRFWKLLGSCLEAAEHRGHCRYLGGGLVFVLVKAVVPK